MVGFKVTYKESRANPRDKQHRLSQRAVQWWRGLNASSSSD